MDAPSKLPSPSAALRRPALVLLGVLLATASVRADVILNGGSLTLVEQGGTIAPGNLAATGTAFAKDLLILTNSPHTISGLNDQQFGNSSSWIGQTSGNFAGISFGATPVPVSSIAFGRDNNGGFTDRTLGVYTLQYTTVPNPNASTTSWTDIGTLNYGAAVAGTNFSLPSRRHRYTFNAVSATGIRLLVPAGGLGTGTCIDELEAYSGIVVTTTADELDTPAGANISLREAVRDSQPGGTIGFAPALSGQTITLSTLSTTLGGEIVIAKSLTIDASSLPAGVTIDGGPGTNRIFSVNMGQTVTLKRLTLTGGNGSGAVSPGFGGAIRNSGTLTLTQCTLSGNSHAASVGGAIFNEGTLALTHSTLSGNSADGGGSGGAISNSGTLTLTHCTLSGNDADGRGSGGAISNSGTLTLSHCTLSGNSADGGGFGGAIRSTGTLTLTNSIVAGNLAVFGENIFATTITGTGANITTGSPLLAPLGHYGGPTQTMPPLPGSPAIDAAAALNPPVTSDQRGFPIQDGDGNGSILPDLGAAESGGTRLVTQTGDSGPGSLRQTLADAAAAAGPDTIVFAPALSGQTLTLASRLLVADPGGVTVDASNLPGGITLSPSAAGHRAIDFTTGSLSLQGLTFSGFSVVATDGGAISSTGRLVLSRCTFTGNSARYGGAIHTSSNVLTMERCSFFGNTAENGGALSLSNSPVNGTHCTFSGNTASNWGGAVLIAPEGTLTLSNSIIAENTAPVGPDVFNFGNPIVLGGVNFIGSLNFTLLQPSGTLLTTAQNGPILLAPLGNYGGPTQTMPLLPGSPAIDAAAALNPPVTADQRGYPIRDGDGNGSILPDLGAAEANTPLIVTQTGDSGPGSLRQTLADAAYALGPDLIVFDPALSGQTITLASQIYVADLSGVTVDASTLPGGLTLSPSAAWHRAIEFTTGSLSLRGLTISGFSGANIGGAIYNSGTLSLTRCTFFGNSANDLGGAIYNYGVLMITQNTFSGNSADEGGAIYGAPGTVTLSQSTLSGNSARAGGAISCLFATLTLTNNIVAGNTATLGFPDVVMQGVTSTIITNGLNLIGDPSGSDLSAGSNVLTGAPLLAPLGNYGGPTQTMPPLPGSPAIDAAAVLVPPVTADQRGFPIRDGDGNGSILPDLGAAEANNTPLIVTQTGDSGPGSLRQTLADAASVSGPDLIFFAPELSGQTITFGSEIAVDDAGGITVDATSLPAGITINGGDATRLLYVATGSSLDITGVTLTGGKVAGAVASGFGGAIYNSGTIMLSQCTLSGNSAEAGGAIYNSGTMTLSQCTLSGNSAGSGGAIYNFGAITLAQSTLSGNSAALGGAIYNYGTSTLTNNIVAGNTASIGKDIRQFSGIITPTDVNFIGDTANSGLTAGTTVLTGAPLLAPLGNYGGPTQTMALLPGSPARNAAAVLSPAITTDQRGFPIVGTPDLGAYEAGTINSFDTWAWETKGSALTFGNDDENDGASNGLEYATRRAPMLADTSLAPEFTFNGGGHGFRFRYQKDATDLRYIVQRSTDLGATGAWQEIYRLDTRTGVITENGVTGTENPATGLIDLTDPTASPRAFWRLLIERVP